MQNSFNTPYKRSWSSKLINLLIVGLCLQVFAQCLEVYTYGSKINTTLFLNFNLDDYLADYIEKLLCLFVALSTVLFLIFRQAFLLWIPALWSFALALTTIVQHSSFGYELTIGAHLARILLPIGLFYLCSKRESDDKKAFALLRIGLASTFIFHGIEAIILKPVFVDYILEASYVLFSYELQENLTYNILYLIGVVDIVVGALIIVGRFPAVLFYMAFWGALTAGCRYFYHGDMGILPMLMRSAHWTIPLFLAFAYLKMTFRINDHRRLRNLSPIAFQGS